MAQALRASNPRKRATNTRLSMISEEEQEEQAESSARFYIAASRIHGTGLFASRPIPRGSWLGDYTGNLLTLEEASLVPDDQSHFHMNNDVLNMVVDGENLSNDMRWINHSCRPNSYVWVTLEGRLRIHAKRSIEAHQEITIDYGPSHWTEEEKRGNIKEDDGCVGSKRKKESPKKIE